MTVRGAIQVPGTEISAAGGAPELDKLKIGSLGAHRVKLGCEGLTGVRAIACGADSGLRIVNDGVRVDAGTVIGDHRSETVPIATEHIHANRLSVGLYLDNLRAEWGDKRVDRALHKAESDLLERGRKGLPLLAGDVNALTTELADFHQENIEEFWEQIKSVCEHPEWQGRSLFSKRQQRSLAELSAAGDTDLYATVRRVFAAHTNATSTNLPRDLYGCLSAGVHCSVDEIDSMLQGQRVEGVITGYPSEFEKHFDYSHFYELRERLQLYEQLCEAPVSDVAFDELLAKALVKKRLEKDMLIPRKILDAEGNERIVQYRVSSMIRTGFGKIAYLIVPAHDSDSRLDDVLVFRSTASSPSMQDSVESLLQDFYPNKPPGYKWNEYGQSKEREAFFGRGSVSERGLRIVGHSLGGSHAQLSLAARVLGTHGALPGLPQRPIKLVTFDSPGIHDDEALDFRDWALHPQNERWTQALHVTHNFSEWDPVPGAGDKHLGYGLTDHSPVRVQSFVHSKLDTKHPRLDFAPHGRHWSWTREGIDYLRQRVHLIDYDDALWRKIVEKGRRIVGHILFRPGLKLLAAYRDIVGHAVR